MLKRRGRMIARAVSCAALLFLLFGTILLPAKGLFGKASFVARRDFIKTFRVTPEDPSAQQTVDRHIGALFSGLENVFAGERQLGGAKYRPEPGEQATWLFDLGDRPQSRSRLVEEIQKLVNDRVRLTREIDRVKELAKRFGLQIYPDEHYTPEPPKAHE